MTTRSATADIRAAASGKRVTASLQLGGASGVPPPTVHRADAVGGAFGGVPRPQEDHLLRAYQREA